MLDYIKNSLRNKQQITSKAVHFVNNNFCFNFSFIILNLVTKVFYIFLLLRQNQFNLLVYGRDRSYFSKIHKIILQNFGLLAFF